MRPYKDTHQHTVSYTFFLIMSKSIALSLLAQGNTGAEILSILDALVADNVSEQSIPTLEEIAF
jgi:hypothetical protein